MRKLYVIFLLTAAVIVIWYWRGLQPVDRASEGETLVTIKTGTSVSGIASALYEKGLIRSPLIFRMKTRFLGATETLKAGAYMLRKDQSMPEIIDVLTEGRTKEILVTIPEGLTVADIDALMASKGFGTEGAIVRCSFRCDFSSFVFLPASNVSRLGSEESIGSRLEGYLYPETYAVNALDYHPKFFLERMLGQFRKIVVEQSSGSIASSRYSLHDIITMASLVEEESRTDDERAIIAGILWKRLENKVVLGVDATTRYEHGKKTEPLTKAELEAITPYNTRRQLGLPPGPIANPSTSSIRAVLHPKTSPYWYYLHGMDGRIRYAVTLQEHNENKAKYLR